MSPRATWGSSGAGGARVAVVALLVALVALGMFLLASARPGTGAFDPRSSSPEGARALVLLLEEHGAAVEVGRDVPGTADARAGRRVLVLEDRLDGAQRGALDAFVRAGGVAVVADPASELHGAAGGAGGGGGGADDGVVEIGRGGPVYDDLGFGSGAPDATNNVRNLACDIAALAELRGLYVDDGVLFPVAADEPRCFAGRAVGETQSFVVVRDLGDGIVVGLGDNELLTNEWLRWADNSGLATALLAPADGAQVTIVLGAGAARTVADIGTGDDSLRDLVRPSVWMALVQLALAFVVFAAARGVRVGRPVAEPRPVPLEGSEVVRASGSIMRAARHHERAGWMLRAELHRELCRRYRIDHRSSVDQLAWAAQDRDGLAPEQVRQALTLDAADDRSLLDLAHRIDAIRHHIADRDAAAPRGAPT